jgi:hypothetical protein
MGVRFIDLAPADKATLEAFVSAGLGGEPA